MSVFLPESVFAPLVPAAKRAGARFGRLGSELDESFRVDWSTGRIDANAARITDACVEALGLEGEALAAGLIELAEGGMAILEPPGDATDPVGIPWRLLSNPLVGDVLSPQLLSRFGIGPAITPALSHRSLIERFPEAPGEVTSLENLERLGAITEAWFLEDLWNGVVRAAEAIGNAVKDLFFPPPEDPKLTLENLATCIGEIQGTVVPWGVKVCFSQDCAIIVSKALTGGASAGKAAVEAALKGVLGLGLPAAIAGPAGIISEIVKGPVGWAMLAIGWYTGISLLANNTPRGVCLVFIWPVTGGFFWYAEGIPEP